jgi:agmatinase
MIVEGLKPLLDAGVIPIMLGGDHSVTLPELRAVANKHGPVALIHFDSHSDTGDKRFGRKYTHGTPMRRALEEELLLVEKSIQVGMRGSIYANDSLVEAREMGFELLTTNQMLDMGLDTVIQRVRERIGNAKTFVSFDIDFVDPAYAPGTGTPEVGGFTSREALQLVRGLDGLDIVAYDMVEVLPQYDPSQSTALLAANIVYEFISLIALEKKRSAGA